MNDDLIYEKNRWRNLYLDEKNIVFNERDGRTYVMQSGETIMTHNKGTGIVTLYEDEIEYALLKGIIDRL